MVYDIDQSGKLEQLNTATVISAASFKHSVSFWISPSEKQATVRILRKLPLRPNDLFALWFAVLISSLISSIPTNNTIRIDEEYTGKNTLIYAVLKQFNNERNVEFARIGKESPAHKTAWGIHRKKLKKNCLELNHKSVVKKIELLATLSAFTVRVQ